MTDDSGSATAPGNPVARREDDALLRGRARFVDDEHPPDAAVLAFVRSDRGHARIAGIDARGAETVDGVVGVYAWDDVAVDGTGRVRTVDGPLDAAVPGHPMLAVDRVRYDGQPIAAVVAEDRYAAADGVAAVSVEYDDLAAVTDPVAATGADAPTLFPAAPDNVVVTTERGDPEATRRALAAADHTVSMELPNNRLAPSPVEPRATLARWDADRERLSVDLTAQNPHGQRTNLAAGLGLPESDVRVRSPHVGGGFGQKDTVYPEPLVAGWLATRLDRPVKWTATRRENLLAGNHGRDNRAEAELGVDDDGTIRALRVDTHSALGAYNLSAAATILSEGYTRVLPGQYDVPTAFSRTRVVVTNTAPVHTYRGGVVPEAAYVTERLVSAAAREAGLDPATLRRRNLVAPEQFP
jgi:carbon-monoxide dehydrogenase large subunit